VAAGDLLPGDLVFFAFERRPADHVGIYAGQGCGVHVASSARRVQVADLGAAAFVRAGAGARRLLPAADDDASGFDRGAAGSR
jgi:cell wall-associated NlpC family hydrolase